MHPNQITTWRSQLPEGAAGVFGLDNASATAEPAVDVKTLHAKIGELTLANDLIARTAWPDFDPAGVGWRGQRFGGRQFDRHEPSHRAAEQLLAPGVELEARKNRVV